MVLTFLILAALCYSVTEVMQFRHGRSIFADTDPVSFWGSLQWRRKYKEPLLKPYKNVWYHKAFNLKYQERFLGSGTIFVWLTDAHHFFQQLMLTFLSLAIWDWDNIWYLVAIRIVWGLVFTVGLEIILTKK